jgi:hypothetical protein
LLQLKLIPSFIWAYFGLQTCFFLGKRVWCWQRYMLIGISLGHFRAMFRLRYILEAQGTLGREWSTCSTVTDKKTYWSKCQIRPQSIIHQKCLFIHHTYFIGQSILVYPNVASTTTPRPLPLNNSALHVCQEATMQSVNFLTRFSFGVGRCFSLNDIQNIHILAKTTLTLKHLE